MVAESRAAKLTGRCGPFLTSVDPVFITPLRSSEKSALEQRVAHVEAERDSLMERLETEQAELVSRVAKLQLRMAN